MQAWVFQPWVQEVLDKRLKQLADAKKPTMGFHIRWGDKIEEDILFVSPHCAVQECSYCRVEVS